MKIAIMHYSAPPVVGGVESVIQAHARLLVAAGMEVVVVAGTGEKSALPEGVEFRQISTMDSQNTLILHANEELEHGSVPEEFSSLSADLGESLRPVFEDVDCTIVHNVFTKHFNLPLTDAFFQLLDQDKLPGCISWGHDFTWTSEHSRSKVSPGYPWDLLRTYRSDVAYVVVSKSRQLELAQLYGCPSERINVIYNGVDPDDVLGLSTEGHDLIDRLDISRSDLILLMPVRITQAKNIEYAVRVVAAMKEKGINPRLVVTGPPDPHDEGNVEYFRSLKKLRHDLNVENEVRFVYESGDQTKRSYLIEMDLVGMLYRAADLMFMPSHREGFGMPVLEAGLAGLTVFSASIPATNEIARDDVHLIDVEKPAQATAAQIIEWAVQNPAQRLRRRIRQGFTWNAIFDQKILPLIRAVGSK